MDLTTHYLDTNILVDYFENNPTSADVCKYRQCTFFNRHTSTTPYEEYWRLCSRMGRYVTRFLVYISGDHALKQSKNTKGRLSYLFKQYWKDNNIDRYEPSSFVKERISSFVDKAIPQMANAYENGHSLRSIISNCTQQIQLLVHALRSRLAKICHSGYNADIILHEVNKEERAHVFAANTSDAFFSWLETNNKDDCKVLAEACLVKREIGVDTLCLITKDGSHFLRIAEFNGIYPCSPKRVLAHHGV